jgi:hypothetical protein
MKTLILSILLLTSSPLSVSADTTAKIEQLVKAQGYLEIWERQIEMGKIERKKQADKMLEQFMSQLSPSKKYTDRFNEASYKFLNTLLGNRTAKDMVATWVKHHAPKFTESELDQLLAFYTSDIGQKEVQANKITVIEFTKHFQKENETLMKNAVNDYIADLKLVAKECNCRKQKQTNHDKIGQE